MAKLVLHKQECFAIKNGKKETVESIVHYSFHNPC